MMPSSILRRWFVDDRGAFLGRLGASPYSYVRNNPLNWIDPTGFTEKEPEGTWYSGFSNLFSSAPILAVDVSPTLIGQLTAVAAAMDFPNGNDAPNSSGCPDGTGTAPRPCAAPGEAGCSPEIGPPTAEEYDSYYTQSQYRAMGLAVAFLGGGTTGVLDFFAAEANSRPDAGVDPSELPIAGPPDGPDAEWEGGLLADPAMRAMTGMAIDAMVLTIAGQAIVTGLSSKSVAGSGPARMRAPFNPSGSRTNCVNGVCAFLRSVKERRLVTASADVALNGGSIARANAQIVRATGVRMSPNVQVNRLNTARDRQLFVVYPGSSARSADHVLIGINNRGKTMLYDPQTGERFTDLDSFGPFVAYPIAF